MSGREGPGGGRWRLRHRLRRVRLVAVGALLVVVMTVLLPFAQEARWTRLCTQQGGQLQRLVGDLEPLLTPQSRIEYACYGPGGQVLDKW